MKIRPVISLLAAAVLGTASVQAQRPDIVIADFEGTNYGAWTVTGTAFGDGPAHGALPNQMVVDGFAGQGFANSYHGGDDARGRMTLAVPKIERKYIQFLIGGGGWEGRTCLNLLVNGQIVSTATGPNVNPGGSERLQPAQWDVSAYLGQPAVLEIVDEATGCWGHITVDQIVQSDQRIAAPIYHWNVARDIRITKPLLNFPVKNGAAKRRVTVSVEGKPGHAFDIELADGTPDWWAFLDANPFQGKSVTVTADRLPEDSTGLSAIDQSDDIKDGASLYHESLRPQFHFTSRRGWLNDPNGLVFYQGEYHLFYQHNPYGWGWGNMSWGHAVSKDLVHWHELPVALYPDEHGTMYSGSAVVDGNNTAGFQTGPEAPLVAMFTAAGDTYTQGLACSNDRGRTWTKYAGNPVLNQIAVANRDPKVVWFAPEKKWVMALYLDGNNYALFSSPDLKHWEKLQQFQLPGDAECPNFFKIPLDGNRDNERWVFYGASGVYVVGKFDGHTFTPETQPRRLEHGNCWYAAQVYSDIPAADGRTILIPWGRLPSDDIFRTMQFNQMMGLPVELTLHSIPAGPELAVAPARELASLRQKTISLKDQTPLTAHNALAELSGDLGELEAEIAPGTAKQIVLDIHGVAVTYDTAAQKLSCLGNQADLPIIDGKITLHIFVDRQAVDIFGDHGRVYMPMAGSIAPNNHHWGLSAVGGEASVMSLKMHELKSAWE